VRLCDGALQLCKAIHDNLAVGLLFQFLGGMPTEESIHRDYGIPSVLGVSDTKQLTDKSGRLTTEALGVNAILSQPRIRAALGEDLHALARRTLRMKVSVIRSGTLLRISRTMAF